MRRQLFVHLGFPFEVESTVLMALALTHLVGRDLRSAEGLLEGIFVDILYKAQTQFGEGLSQFGASLRFFLRPSRALQAHLVEVLGSARVGTHLVTRDWRMERLIRRALPKASHSLQVAPSRDCLPILPPGTLVVLDCLEGFPESTSFVPDRLDAHVQCRLVDSDAFQLLEPHLRDATIPVHRDLGKSQKSLSQGLAEALETARFSKLFDRLQASRLRWRTHWNLVFNPTQGLIQAVFHFDGEERVLRAMDLKRDIPWAETPNLRFSDVLGVSVAKAQLQDHLNWLKNPRSEPGLRTCILSGPPGTGKTHLCLATAGEANVPCIVMGGAEFISQWYGETERIIRETFASLCQYDAAVLVIDEFEGIAWSRAQSNQWEAQHQASIIGELLRSVDRLRKGRGRVLLLATTNQYERLDAALVRSMRMDGRIHLGLPDAAERRAVLDGILPEDFSEPDRKEAVGLTTGLSCADLFRLVTSARNDAAASGSTFNLSALRVAVFEARQGPAAGSGLQDPVLRGHVAIHEAGHALVAFLLLGGEALDHVSICPSVDGALGAAYLRPPEDLELIGRTAIRNRIAILLAGRAAELLVYPEEGSSCGVSSDLQNATSLASTAISQWGMDEAFPLLSIEGLPSDLRQQMSAELLQQIRAWLDDAQAFATTLLRNHQGGLEQLAEALERDETLHRPELLELLRAMA